MLTHERTYPPAGDDVRRPSRLVQWAMVAMMAASMFLYGFGHKEPARFFAIRDAIKHAIVPGR